MKAAKRKKAVAAPASDAAKDSVPQPIAGEEAVSTIAAPVSAPAAPSTSIVTLASSCTVKDAAALKQSLCAAVDSEIPVTLDVRSIERIDTATMQLLCAFARQRAASARGIVWMGVPAVLEEAARLLGVQAMLGLPAAASGVAP